MSTVRLDSFDGFDRNLLLPYQIPDGHYDVFCPQVWNPPFFAYNRSGQIGPPTLVDGGEAPALYTQAGGSPNILNQGLLIDDKCDFVLRAVALPKGMAARMQLYTPGKQQFFDLPIPIPNNLNIDAYELTVLPILPEVVYPAGSQITFDLIGWNQNGFLGSGTPTPTLANNIVTLAGQQDVNIYTGQIVFYGVKRYRGNLRNPGPSNYSYREQDFTYVQEFNLDWSQFTQFSPTQITFSTNARRFGTLVRSYDFELRQISFQFPNPATFSYQALFGPATWGGAEAGPLETFRVQFYDAADNPLSSGSNGATSNAGYAGNNTGMQPRYWGYTVNDVLQPLITFQNITLPCPPVLYPAGSLIRAEVLSLVAPLAPGSNNPVRIIYRGVQRMPCAG